MLSTIHSVSINGLQATRVLIEVNLEKLNAQRDPFFIMVGLPDNAVKESRTRVRTALQNSGYHIRNRYDVAVNFAPADVRKEGSGFDLPLAIGQLCAATDEKPAFITVAKEIGRYVFLGELGLNGELRPVRGVLLAAILARKMGYEGIFVPADNAREAAVVDTLKVYGAQHLKEVVEHLTGVKAIAPTVINTREVFYAAQNDFPFDFSEVKGQENVKRAFEIAAAGGHNIILIGSPGCGKSMMAKRMPSILPPLTLHESLETTQIHSIAGKLKKAYRAAMRSGEKNAAQEWLCDNAYLFERISREVYRSLRFLPPLPAGECQTVLDALLLLETIGAWESLIPALTAGRGMGQRPDFHRYAPLYLVGIRIPCFSPAPGRAGAKKQPGLAGSSGRYRLHTWCAPFE